MGPTENPTSLPRKQPTSSLRRRKLPTCRPRTRQCLLKGCEKRYRPRRALQRYCSVECRRAARDWSRWKAQQRYRVTVTGQEKRRAQSRRYRKRIQIGREQLREAAEAAARVITIDFFRGSLRPARLLPRIHAQPEIAPATLLLQGVPAGSGARLAAGEALEEGTRRTIPMQDRFRRSELDDGGETGERFPKIVLKY
jgi:hypothetical protein